LSTISKHTYTATLLVDDGYPLAVQGGQITMDEGWAPHVQAQLTIAMPEETVLELLDPRDDVRVLVTAESEFSDWNNQPLPATSRSFNLCLRSRIIRHESAEVTLDLASDEALLQDDVLVDDEPNRDALAYQESLRSIIDEVVLSRIGAHLEPGDADAPYRVLADATNLITNPGAEVDLTGAVGTGVTLARQVGSAPFGTAMFRLNPTGAADSYMEIGGSAGALRNGMQAGRRYTASGTFMITSPMTGTAHARARRIVVFTRVGSGSYVETASAQAPNVAGQYRLSVTFDVPVGATEAFIRWYHGHTASVCYWDGLVLHEFTNEYDTDQWDGDSVDTSEYAYAWTGTPGLSTTTRTAVISRSADALQWEPGESSWSFVQPLFQTAGFRLFCDDQRRWWLVDTSYIAPGFTQLSAGYNVIDPEDTISRDTDEWYDAVLVKYRWRDETGAQQIAYDQALSPAYTKAIMIEVERPYPGPGAANYILRRAAGKGRTLDLGGVSNYAAQPTQPVTAILPASPIQTGVVASVRWSFDDDEMRIGTRGLTDTPPTAYVFGPPGVSYLDVPPGISYEEFDWSVV